MLSRNGTVEIEDPNAFAAEWQVREDLDGPMLFMVDAERQYPQTCVLLDTNMKESRQRRLGESISREAAEKACAHWIENKEACIYDVMATADIDLADAGAF